MLYNIQNRLMNAHMGFLVLVLCASSACGLKVDSLERPRQASIALDGDSALHVRAVPREERTGDYQRAIATVSFEHSDGTAPTEFTVKKWDRATMLEAPLNETEDRAITTPRMNLAIGDHKDNDGAFMAVVMRWNF